jgi:hypothetical protein
MSKVKCRLADPRKSPIVESIQQWNLDSAGHISSRNVRCQDIKIISTKAEDSGVASVYFALEN